MKLIKKALLTCISLAMGISLGSAEEDLQRANDIGEIFQVLEHEIPNLSGLEERSLIVPCDGRMYSVAQLGWWSKRVIPRDEASRKVVWGRTESRSAAVRYIAFCAIFESFGISWELLPKDISIFHSTRNMNSDEYKKLAKWLRQEIDARKNDLQQESGMKGSQTNSEKPANGKGKPSKK